MAQRKVRVLTKARDEVAYIAYFIESKGMPDTAKKFVDDCIDFFEKLGNPKINHRPCSYIIWKIQGFRCASFKKKFVVAFIYKKDEIVICDFASHKLMIA
jgi:plasmid stabilization system protein ParE